jgi:hypothetical protein
MIPLSIYDEVRSVMTINLFGNLKSFNFSQQYIVPIA